LFFIYFYLNQENSKLKTIKEEFSGVLRYLNFLQENNYFKKTSFLNSKGEVSFI
jgi:hypothetical protein